MRARDRAGLTLILIQLGSLPATRSVTGLGGAWRVRRGNRLRRDNFKPAT